MARLTIDPWEPGYGGSIELDEDGDLVPVVADFDVEPVAWAPQVPDELPTPPRCAFVDGVRRVDVRLFASTDETEVHALAGSWAVGAAWNADPPFIDHVTVRRDLIVGGGMDHPDLLAPLGSTEIVFTFSGVDEEGAHAPLVALQNNMRKGEAELAKTVLASGNADLVLLDGPLTYFSANGPLVGVIKRQNRMYLQGDRAGILERLTPGTRTPLFRLGEQRLERYTWYTRIARGRPIDGVRTGILRIEVSAEVGRKEAIRLADTVSALLPRFASHAWHDPRAPQNLYPVSQLEHVLRHRLGDPMLVRRAVELELRRQYS